MFFEDFVGKLCAGLEGDVFGEDKRVVAVEEDVGDLAVRVSASNSVRSGSRGGSYLGHDGLR
jgi:hypothetical protein